MSDLKLPRFSAEANLPSTFEERGAAVAFTTPALAGARIRTDDRHGLTVLIKNFAGSVAIYAIPIGALFEVFSTTVHDRALIDAIQAAKAHSPSAIRRETLRVMALGLAGPNGKAKAAEIIEADGQFRSDLEGIVLISTLRAINADMSRFSIVDFKDSQAVLALKAHLYSLMTPFGLEPELVDRRLIDLSDALSFIGFAKAGLHGRLRNLLSDLKTFEETMRNKAASTNAEFGVIFDFAAKTANQTLDISNPILVSLDSILNNLVSLMTNWDTQFVTVLRCADRLSWLLDGWEAVLAFSADCDEWNADTVWENSELLATMLPMVPRDETLADDEEQPDFNLMGSRARVLALHNWKDGKIDQEMVRRIEAAKSAMKENGSVPVKMKRTLNPSEVEWQISII